jgi:transposase
MVVLAGKTREELVETAQALVEDNTNLNRKVVQLEAKIAWFEEQFRLAQHRRFGASSEQTPVGQEALLFNEAEACATPALPEPTVEEITYKRRKTKGHREAQLAGLPVEEIPYELPEAERICPQCSGALHEMGTEVRQELKIVPAQVSVVRHIRAKYACRHCQAEETTTPILTAPMPKPAFPNSVASASAAAHIMSEKFVMGSPLYRIEQQLERNGLNLSRQTMANWMIKGAGWLETVYDRMKAELLARDIVHADETTLQVLREPNRDAKTDSYMWLYRTGREGPAIVLFDYQTTRAGSHPKDFLGEYDGYLNVDGYAGYDALSAQLTLAGCWTHARRKFDEAVKALPAVARKNGAAQSSAHAGLAFCNALYKIESDLKGATDNERFAARIERSKPVLDAFKLWLDENAASVLPKSALGTAIAYCRNQWTKLNAFLLDGRLEIDNNRAERSIKPFVIGRKNWLFANTPKGARASAVIYSLVETAKENGLNPFAYLEHLFEALPNIDADDPAVAAGLLPWATAVQQKCRIPRRK